MNQRIKNTMNRDVVRLKEQNKLRCVNVIIDGEFKQINADEIENINNDAVIVGYEEYLE